MYFVFYSVYQGFLQAKLDKDDLGLSQFQAMANLTQ